MGKCEKERAEEENSAFLDGVELLANSGIARELAWSALKEYGEHHKTFLAGRFATGATVSYTLGRGVKMVGGRGGLGTALGLSLAAGAINGDIRFNIESGMDAAEAIAHGLTGKSIGRRLPCP
jgi:hypothetical protein